MEGRAGIITPLRLVVMSATLRVEEFVGNKKLCPTPPALLKVAARQFPVTVHFSRETVHGDYLGAAKKKVLAIHRKLPSGGVLVFPTGPAGGGPAVREAPRRAPRPRRPGTTGGNRGARGRRGAVARAIADGSRTGPRDIRGGTRTPPGSRRDDVDAADGDGSDERNRRGENSDEDSGRLPAGRDDFDDAGDHDDSASDVSEEDEVVVHAGEGVDPEEAAAAEADWVRAHAPTTAAAAAAGDASGGDVARDDGPHTSSRPSAWYAMLPPDLQRRVFDPPPPGSREGAVVATNATRFALLTIPGVRYVVSAAGRNDASTATTPPARAAAALPRRVSPASPWSG